MIKVKVEPIVRVNFVKLTVFVYLSDANAMFRSAPAGLYKLVGLIYHWKPRIVSASAPVDFLQPVAYFRVPFESALPVLSMMSGRAIAFCRTPMVIPWPWPSVIAFFVLMSSC